MNASHLLCRSLLICAFLLFFQGCTVKKKTQLANNVSAGFYSMEDFKRVDKIVIHVHIKADDSSFIRQAREDNFRLFTINVNSPSSPPVEEQQRIAVDLVKKYPDRVAYATTFTVNGWNTANWQEETLSYLKESIAKGAKAVKIWKNVGMDLKDKDGRFVMIDNPKFDPILDFLAKNRIPVIGHLGEPKNCWLPIEKMTVNGDKQYYREHPEYHMYLHPEYPSYEDQVNARDRMLEKHPRLSFIGAHLGSLEWNVDELAKRLDKFPSMSVDMAARITHLQYQATKDRQKVYDFCVKYQDRLIYATDQTINATTSMESFNKRAHETWLTDWKFFATDEKMTVTAFEETFNGLKLPREVIDKIYRENAKRWLGIFK